VLGLGEGNGKGKIYDEVAASFFTRTARQPVSRVGVRIHCRYMDSDPPQLENPQVECGL